MQQDQQIEFLRLENLRWESVNSQTSELTQFFEDAQISFDNKQEKRRELYEAAEKKRDEDEKVRAAYVHVVVDPRF